LVSQHREGGPVTLADFTNRADEVLALGERARATEGKTSWGGTHVDPGLFGEFRASALALIRDVFGEKHPLFRDADKALENAIGLSVNQGLGVVRAARTTIAKGWLTTTTGIVSAAIFADFLEMAQHLFEQGYKDPAAVLVGGVLEERLRQLCDKNSIPLVAGTSPKKADAMNSELAAAAAYSKLDQKMVTGWLDLRNKAAHGRYGEYTAEQVDLMLRGVGDFVARNPL